MREATGELNVTVIVVIFVTLLVSFFSFVVWPFIKGNMKHESKCSDAICERCTTGSTCETVKCHMKDAEPDDPEFYCPYKG